jgi:hypothetical protein
MSETASVVCFGSFKKKPKDALKLSRKPKRCAHPEIRILNLEEREIWAAGRKGSAAVPKLMQDNTQSPKIGLYSGRSTANRMWVHVLRSADELWTI